MLSVGLTLVMIFLVIIVYYVYYYLKLLFKTPPVPKLQEVWWGSTENSGQEDPIAIRSFRINISEKVLKDLQHRLKNHRPFTAPLENVQQQYGTNTRLLNDFITYWTLKYNWREREKYLNKYPQFTTNIQGLNIHFIHVKPSETNLKILPLLLLHGWPGSTREFYETIPLLTTPNSNHQFVFEVIVPHLPGFGFSEATNKKGLGTAQMAVLFKNLMLRLGFQQFYVQGGDLGAVILQEMAVLFPEVVLGFHTNMCTVYTPKALLRILLGSFWGRWVVKQEHHERIYPLRKLLAFGLQELGYLHLQATKPDTLGVGLGDSPAGLAAYFLEKFVTGTNFSYQNLEDGGFSEGIFSYDDLIDNIMIYWVTNSVTTSFRLYAETFNYRHLKMGLLRIPVKVPTAIARFRYDFYTPDGVIKEIFPNLLQLSDYEGGHFAAFQLPKILSEDVWNAIDKFESYWK